MTPNARERLIVALDVPDIAAAEVMIDALDGCVEFFKVGLTLQLAPGVERLIQSLIDRKKRVFLDYKYYDIPETVNKAVSRAVARGVSFLTIHGSRRVIEGAVKGRGSSDLKLFAVTVLTSMDQSDLKDLGYSDTAVEDLVIHRAKMALSAGCDGVIASGQEAAKIKALAGKLLVVTPGIRPDGSAEDDQKRRVTPAQAILAGADYLVVGRPITNPASGTPRHVAEAIVAEMQQAFGQMAVPAAQ
jgi:orotidine-5'-phosphate decarboxylase